MYLLDRSSGLQILNWTMLISFIYFTFFSLVRLFQKKYNEGIISLFSAIIIVTVELKTWFYYYNFYLNLIILIAIGIVFYSLYKRYNVSITQLSFPLVFLLISLVVNQIPDIKVFQYVSSMVSYQSLTWNDFQGQIDYNSKFDASIKAGINFKTNYASNPTQFLVFTGMVPEKSWVKKSNEGISFDKLLNHEQRHFDLVKIHEILLKDSLRKVKYNPKTYEDIIKYFSEKEDSTSIQYDEFTSHGILHLKQRIWNNKIDSIFENQQIPLLSGNDLHFRRMQKKAIKQAQLCVGLTDTITKIFNSRNELIKELNSQRKGNLSIDQSLLNSIDSISNNLENELKYSILRIENGFKEMSDQELYTATLDFLNKIHEIEIAFQPFFYSIKTSNKLLEQQLSGPLVEKALKIKSNQEHWEKVKDKFLKKYELYSEDLD